jgi:predicted nucleic acid-binding protein
MDAAQGVIFLDANVLLRTFVAPHDAVTRRLSQLSAELLHQADRGEVTVTTSDAVLAEVAFILTARAHANLPVSVAAGLIATIVRLRGFHHREKRAILLALELWVDRPRLGFVDALTAAYAKSPGMLLATFDSDFDSIPDLERWVPAESN